VEVVVEVEVDLVKDLTKVVKVGSLRRQKLQDEGLFMGNQSDIYLLARYTRRPWSALTASASRLESLQRLWALAVTGSSVLIPIYLKEDEPW
jgi:hypothetical protein